MVADVIRSEIILNKKNLLVNSCMVLCLAVGYPLLMEELGATIAISCFLLGFLPPALLARQSKVKADATICALPVTRGQLVRGKYAFLGMWTRGL